MYILDTGAVTVIAGDSKAALMATDQAMRAHAQLMISFSEGTGRALPIGISQDVLIAVHEAQADLLKSRAQLRRTMTLLTAIHSRSDQRETNFGCPVGFPFTAALDAGLDGCTSDFVSRNIQPLEA